MNASGKTPMPARALYLRIVAFCAMVTVLGCGLPMDPHTPEGAHATVQRLLETHDYRTLYSMIASGARRDFSQYIDSTRQAAREIRMYYPEGMKFSALQTLTIPLPQSALRLQEIEADIDVDSLFSIFCHGVLRDRTLELTPIRSLGLNATSIEQTSSDEAVVHTLGDERIIYRREADGIWRTADLFGKQFEDMARVSRANLEVIRRNIVVFSQ